MTRQAMFKNIFLTLYPFTRIALAIILASVFTLSCNRDEDIPSYIRIGKIDFQVDSAKVQGTSSNKITDAWVYIDGDFVGVYELPVTFPVLYEGMHTIKVKAGIKINGIAATRGSYPFYTTWEINQELNKGKITTLDPVMNYAPYTDFAWMEDFELPGVKFIPNPSSDTTLQITADPSEIFEGKQSGKVIMAPNHLFFEAVSSTKFPLPKGGSPVYLEMNYKSNTVFAVGIYAYEPGQTSQVASLYINPVSYWNKIYVNLTEQVSSYSNAINYAVFIGFYREPDVVTPTLYFDNIKLVH